MTRKQQRIELLQAETDENDQSFFRVLVDGRTVKYITIDPGIFSIEDMCFGPSLASILPDLPDWDWNDGLVTKDASGRPCFSRASRTAFPGVENTWHGTCVDYQDIVIDERLRTGVYAVKCPMFDTAVVAKFARFYWEIQYLENETTAYQWIDGHDIGPRFLGHLVEDGRVIGVLIERVRNARHAGIEDLEVCQKALSRLHSLGIRHGDINRFNFLISGSRAILIDFGTSRRCDDEAMLREEFENLPRYLQDTSGIGGPF